MKKNRPKTREKKFADEWDFSEGFGGISQDLDLTKNIGCASGGYKKPKPTVSDNHKNSNK